MPLTRDQLEQLKSLKQEVKQLQEELCNLPLTKDSVKGSMPEFPYIERTIKIVGIDEDKTKKVRVKLEKTLAELQDMILVMEGWLDTVEDPEIRTILRLHYRNGLTYEKIAEEISRSEKTVQRRLKQFWRGVL